MICYFGHVSAIGRNGAIHIISHAWNMAVENAEVDAFALFAENVL
jgi:hypothetical protein